MNRLFWLIDNPAKELNPFTEILSVKVGSTIAEQKQLQKLSFVVKSSPTRFYFSIRNNESQAFIGRLLENGFHNIREVRIGEAWNIIKNQIANPSNVKKTHVRPV